AALHAATHIVFAREQRAHHRAALQKQSIAIALQHLEAEWGLEQTQGRHHVGRRGWSRPAQRRLRADQARSRAAHRVAVQLERAGDQAVIQVGAQAGTPYQKAVLVEWIAGRAVDLILG